MEGLHSPWGQLGRIAEQRGWTFNQVLWNDSWVNLVIANADQPRYVKGQQAQHVNSIDELKRAMGRE